MGTFLWVYLGMGFFETREIARAFERERIPYLYPSRAYHVTIYFALWVFWIPVILYMTTDLFKKSKW